MIEPGVGLAHLISLHLADARERGTPVRYLFLDDDRRRHTAFDTMASGCLVAHVWTADECIETLAREGETFDCVFLDHDLEGETFVTAIQGSGTEVAHFIRDHLPAVRCPRSVVVHSLNPDGAGRMMDALRERGVTFQRIPFSSPDY